MRDIVDRLYAAYNDHDAEAAAALYSEDGRHREVAQDAERSGREQIRGGLAHFLEAFPDARWRPLEIIATEDRAAVTYELTGRLSTRLGPFEPQRQPLRLRGVHVLAVSDGAIELSEDYWDSGTFGRQMSRDQAVR